MARGYAKKNPQNNATPSMLFKISILIKLKVQDHTVLLCVICFRGGHFSKVNYCKIWTK